MIPLPAIKRLALGCMGHEEWSSRKGIFNFANVNLALNLVHCKGQRFWNFMPNLLHYSSSSKKPKIQHLQSGYLDSSFWRKVLFNPFYFLAKSNFFEYNMCWTSANLPLNSIRGILSARVNLNGKKSTYTCCWAMICQSSKFNLKSFGSFGKISPLSSVVTFKHQKEESQEQLNP